MNQILALKKNKAFMLFSIIATSFTLLFLSSCLKDSNLGNGPNANVESPISALAVIHAAPDAPAFDFVLNNDLVLPPNISYGERMLYFYPFSGNYLARFYKHKTFTDPLYSTKINLARGKYHSLFLTGLEADSLTSLLLEDDLTRPKEGKAKLRFLNLSPDAGPLDFAIVTDSLFASQKDFKEYTTFYEIDPDTYSAKFTSHTGDAVDFDFELKIERGKIYTVVVRGLVKTTNVDQKLKNGLINHVE